MTCPKCGAKVSHSWPVSMPGQASTLVETCAICGQILETELVDYKQRELLVKKYRHEKQPLKFCAVPGCKRKVHAKNLCDLHYQRLRKYQRLSRDK